MHKIKGNIIVLGLLAFITGLYSCKEDDIGGAEQPTISFISITTDKDPQGYDTLISITFSYQDGNGDLGYRPGDTFPPFDFNSQYFNNLLVEFESKENGQYIVPDIFGVPLNFSERFESLTPSGNNKSIKGEMTLRIPAVLPGVAPDKSKPDTIRCRLKLVDRALNESNVINTGDVYITQRP